MTEAEENILDKIRLIGHEADEAEKRADHFHEQANLARGFQERCEAEIEDLENRLKNLQAEKI